jgi:hypothetical protein
MYCDAMCIGLQSMPNTHKHTIFFLDVKSLLCFQHVLCLVEQRRQGSGWRAPAHAQYSLILPVYLQMIADVPFARLSATDCRRYSKICGCLRALCFSRHHLDEIRWYHSECTHQRGAHETASQLVFHGIVVTITPIRPIIHEQLIGQSSLRVSSAGLTCQALLGHGRTHRKNKTKCSLESWEPIKIEIWNLSMSCSVETGRHVQGWQEQVHNEVSVFFLFSVLKCKCKHNVNMA